MEHNTENEEEETFFSGVDKAVSFALHNSHNHKLKYALNQHTEHYAYEYILPLLSHKNLSWREYEAASLRIVGLIASTNVKQDSSVTFGQWVKKNTNNASETGIKTRLNQIVGLRLEDAVQAVSRIISLSDGANNGFNWYDLGHVFVNWGDGMSEISIATRQKLIRNYYVTGNHASNDN